MLPTVVSDRTAMPHSADRHNKTTSRPTQNTLGSSAPPRTTGPAGTAPPAQPQPVGWRVKPALCIIMRCHTQPLDESSSSWLMLLIPISQLTSCSRLNESFWGLMRVIMHPLIGFTLDLSLIHQLYLTSTDSLQHTHLPAIPQE